MQSTSETNPGAKVRSSEGKGEKQGTKQRGLHTLLKSHGQLREVGDSAEEGN